jgi:16S rRNA G966 N2-methylase RsmD
MDSTQSLRDFIMKTRSQREKLKLVSSNLEKAIQIRSNSPHIFLSKRLLKIMESREISSNSSALIKPSTAQANVQFYSKSKPNPKNQLKKSPPQKPAYQIYIDPPFPLHAPKGPNYHSKKRVSSMNQQEISRLEVSPIKKHHNLSYNTHQNSSKKFYMRNKSLSSGFRSKRSIKKMSSCIELPY